MNSSGSKYINEIDRHSQKGAKAQDCAKIDSQGIRNEIHSPAGGNEEEGRNQQDGRQTRSRTASRRRFQDSGESN